MVMSSNATLSTASWSRSCSLKFTRACVLVTWVRLLTPPCVTRCSGGAVVHDRGALLRRGLRRRKTTHHVVELGSQHYRGQFNVVPGTGCRRGLPPPRAPGARRAATCCRRARRASFLIGGGGVGASAVVPRGDGCTRRSVVQHGCHTAVALLCRAAMVQAQVQKPRLGPPLCCAPLLPTFCTAATLASVR